MASKKTNRKRSTRASKNNYKKKQASNKRDLKLFAAAITERFQTDGEE